MRSLVGLLVAGAFFAAALVGCGSDTKCGPGTHLVDGTCVQVNPMDCDPDTAELVDGVCQAKPGGGTCGPGTKQNPGNPEECIPDCGAGTALDPVTKKCIPEGALIQPNVVEKASDENNDPMTEGTPISFTLPAEGGSTILAGVIGAPQEDQDGYLVADYDGWQFTTTGPTLLNIEGLPVSHIRFAFWIAPADDPGAAERVGFDANADHAVRQVWLDRAGDWVLVASDANNLNDMFHWIFGIDVDAPVGSDDATFNYAFRVTRMARPEDAVLQPATTQNDAYSEGVRFYSMNPTVGQIIEFWNVPTSSDATPVTAVYNGTSAEPRTTYDILAVTRASGQELHFVTDYQAAWGTDLSTQYLANQVTPVALGVLSAPVTRPGDVVSVEGTSMYYTFSASTPTLIYAAADPGAGPLAPIVGLYDATLELLDYPTPDFLVTAVAPAQITEYVVRVNDAAFGGGSTYAFDLSLTSMDASTGGTTAEVEPNEDTGTAQVVAAALPVVIAGNISAGTDGDWYKVTLPAGMTTLVIQTLPGLANAIDDTIVTLANAAGTTLSTNDDIVDADDNAYSYFSRIVEIGLTPADYLIKVKGYTPTSGTPSTGDYLLFVAAK